MQLSIESPRNGWLPVTIGMNETQFQFNASNVSEDVVSSLISVAGWLSENDLQSETVTGPIRRTVHFFCEPIWNSLAFDRVSGSASIAVSYFHEHESASALKASQDDLLLLTPLRFGQYHRVELRESISHAISEMFHRTPLFDYYENWGHPLTQETFTVLRRLLRSRNVRQ